MKQASTQTILKRQTLRVLIADDNPTARAGLRALLQSFRNTLNLEFIGEAENGIEAVELSQLNTPDLIFLDARMPRMNGIEATKRIKLPQPHTKILVLSVDPSYRKSAISAGADGFILKGFTPRQLHHTILNVTTPAKRRR